jgi:hypothetical protein
MPLFCFRSFFVYAVTYIFTFFLPCLRVVANVRHESVRGLVGPFFLAIVTDQSHHPELDWTPDSKRGMGFALDTSSSRVLP